MSDINNNDEEKYCSMCGRSEKDAGHMVHMPFGMYLCPDCMDKVSSTMEERMKDMPGMDSSGGALDLSKMMQQMGMAVPAGEDIYATSAANDLQTDPSGNPDGEEGTNDKEKKEEKKKGPKISFMNLGDLPFGNPFGELRATITNLNLLDLQIQRHIDKKRGRIVFDTPSLLFITYLGSMFL